LPEGHYVHISEKQNPAFYWFKCNAGSSAMLVQVQCWFKCNAGSSAMLVQVQCRLLTRAAQKISAVFNLSRAR
jgi:hypothetical protein